MNRDRMKGKMKQVRGKVQEEWGKLRKSNRDVVRGRGKQLAGRVQEVYGVARETAEREIERPGVRRVRVRVVRRRRTAR